MPKLNHKSLKESITKKTAELQKSSKKKSSRKTTKIRKKARAAKGKIMPALLSFKPIQLLVNNRRAESAVMSNLILITAVIAVGFAVLAWEQNQTTQYQQTQSSIINDDMNQLKERLSFEYISYNGTSLTVYIINSGTNNNVNVTSIQIGSNSPILVNDLHRLNGTQAIGLNIGQDGYFTVSTNLTQGTSYSIRIRTSRGSDFVTNFAY